MPASETRLREQLRRYWRPPVVVLGVGRREHGDDAFGPLLIDRLPAAPGLVGIDCGTVPENFIGVVAGRRPGLVLLADAVRMETPAGTVCLLEPEQLGHITLGTHALTPAMLLELIRERVGAPCLVLAVGPEQVGPGLAASPAASSAVERTAALLGSLAAEKG